MQIQINPGDVPSSAAIDQHIQDEVAKAMRHFGEQVTRVEVHLHDENSPLKKGQADKKCVMEARLAGLKPIAVHDEGDDLYLTIKHAAEKLARAVSHRLGRLDSHKEAS